MSFIIICAEWSFDENLKLQDMKILEEKLRCLTVSEQQANFFISDLKAQMETQAVNYLVSLVISFMLVDRTLP